VLANDSDADGDRLSVATVDRTGTKGKVTDNGDGTFAYDPNGKFAKLAKGESATDTFAYTVSDGQGGRATAIVTIQIDGVDDALPPADDKEESRTPDSTAPDDTGSTDDQAPAPAEDTGLPTAVDDAFTTDEDTPFTTGDLRDNDSDAEGGPLTIVEVRTGPTKGTVTDNGDGTFGYEPNGQFEDLAEGESDTDHFTYTVSDGNGGTSSATVTIRIDGVSDSPETVVNDSPDAVDDAGAGFDTDQNTPFTTDSVLANDSDPDGDALAVTAVDTTGTQGQVTDNGDGTFAYDPTGTFAELAVEETATDTFTYTVDYRRRRAGRHRQRHGHHPDRRRGRCAGSRAGAAGVTGGGHHGGDLGLSREEGHTVAVG
jgi:VCBS repeat-containing protein